MSGVTNKVVRDSPATLTLSDKYLKSNAIRLAHLVCLTEACQTAFLGDAQKDMVSDNKPRLLPDNAEILTLLKHNLSTNDFNYLYIHLPCLFKPRNSNS